MRRAISTLRVRPCRRRFSLRSRSHEQARRGRGGGAEGKRRGGVDPAGKSWPRPLTALVLKCTTFTGVNGLILLEDSDKPFLRLKPAVFNLVWKGQRSSEKHGFLYGFFLPVDTHKSWPYSNKVGFTNHGFFQAPPASKRIEFLLRFFIRIQSHAPNFFRIREVESKCKALVRDTLGP